MKSLSVLLVDNDTRVRPFVVANLAPFVRSLFVDHELSLTAGLRSLRNASELPDVVITDLKMSDAKRLDAPRAFRRDFPAMPLVILTGTYAREEAIADSFFDFVRKECIMGTDCVAAQCGELFGRVRLAMDRALVSELGSGRIPVSGLASTYPPAIVA